MNPRRRCPALANQLVHVNAGDKAVIDRNEYRTSGDKCFGKKSEGTFVAAHPVTAMKEDLDRRRLNPVDRKYIETLGWASTVGKIKARAKRPADLSVVVLPALNDLPVLRHSGARVVLSV
jgi:hypothetical protein